MAGAMAILPVTMSAQAKGTEVNSVNSIYSRGTINADGVRVRSTPSTSGTVIGLLYKGDIVEVLSTTGSWSYCQTVSGVRGYILSRYIN